MKKVVAILLALVMLLTFAACAKPAETEAPAAEEPATTETTTETPAAEEPAAEQTPAADEAIVVDLGGESASAQNASPCGASAMRRITAGSMLSGVCPTPFVSAMRTVFPSTPARQAAVGMGAPARVPGRSVSATCVPSAPVRTCAAPLRMP